MRCLFLKRILRGGSIACVMLLPVAFAGCRGERAGIIPTSIKGTVRDAAGAAMTDVSISTEPATQSIKTDASGSYNITQGITPRTSYRVTASKAGYVPGQALFIPYEGALNQVDLMLAEAAPKLGVSRNTVDLGGHDTRDVIILVNQGTSGTSLSWAATTATSWLHIDPASGTLGAKSATMTVTVDRSQFGTSYGQKSATIDVTSDAGSASIIVQLDHLNPELPQIAVSSDRLAFESLTTELGLVLRNVGTGALNWSATPSQPWLTVEPSSGSLSYGPSQLISVKVSRLGLPLGSQTATVNLTSSQSGVTGKQVAVTLTVDQKPQIAITPTDLELFGVSQQGAFVIQNVGTGTLTYSIDHSSSPWLTIVSGTSGTVASGSSANLVVLADRRTAPPGRRAGELFITSDGGNRTVTVGITATTTPLLTIDPGALALGLQDEADLLLQNLGGGTVNWTLAAVPEWLTVTPTSGTLTTIDGSPPGSTLLHVKVARAGHAPGTLTGSLVFDGGTDGTWSLPSSATVPFGRWVKSLAGGPQPRIDAALGWDPIRKRLILFGGNPDNRVFPPLPPYGDTWAYDPATDAWANLHPTAPPAAKPAGSFVWDPGRQALVLFGFDVRNVTSVNAAAAAFDGADWSLDPAVPLAVNASGDPNHTDAYDVGGIRQGLVYIADAATQGAINSYCGNKYATSQRNAVVRYDDACRLGSTGSDCFTTIGNTTGICSNGVATLGDGSIMVVGNMSSGDQLQASWTQHADGSGAADIVHFPVADLQRRKYAGAGVGSEILLFGGIDSAGTPTSTLLRFYGSHTNSTIRSEALSLANAPPARLFASMAYDPDDDTVFVFGGRPGVESGNPFGDLWKLELYHAR